MYWMVSKGGLALSRVSNRFAVRPVDSSPRTNQPKLLPGLSNHSCTSAIICAQLHVYCPHPTDLLARADRCGEDSTLRGPKNRVEKTMPPRSIVRRSRCSGAFLSTCLGSSFAPIGQQLV
jgi:hypothetical protein